jgi:FtsH-binding integral membrane protein
VVWVLEEVPWGNLWRTAVTTYLFFALLGAPLAIFTSFDEGTTAGIFQSVILLVAAVLASIVVWSDTVSWVGDYRD